MTKQLAMVFPGQGSQSVGMLQDIAQQYPEVQKTFSEASSALDYDLWELVVDGPAEKLNQTVHTQPAILAASYAVWQILKVRKHFAPAMMAGHSLGEYTALVCADAIAFTDAIRLVAARGQYMQEAVPAGSGAMAAIVGLDDATVSSLCEAVADKSNQVLAPANFNSIGQVVVAGETQAVTNVVANAKELGAKLAMVLPVSVPSHCELMLPAAEKMAPILAKTEIKTPAIPVLNNADVQIYDSPEMIRRGLASQLCMPVRWVETIELMSEHGIKTMIECGPGKVLTGLNKRINKSLRLLSTGDISSLESCLAVENEGA